MTNKRITILQGDRVDCRRCGAFLTDDDEATWTLQDLPPDMIAEWLLNQPLLNVLKLQEELAKHGISMNIETAEVELVERTP